MEANQEEAKEFGSDVKNIFSKSQFRKSISRFPRLFKLQSEISVSQFPIYSIAKCINKKCMNETTALTITDWTNDQYLLKLKKPWPKEANNLSLQNIFKYCLEPDSLDDNIFRQHQVRERDLNFAYRNFIDDSSLGIFYLHLFNSIKEGDKIAKETLPIWIDNASFLSSEHYFKIKK